MMIWIICFAFWLAGAVFSNAVMRQMGLASADTYGDSFSGDDMIDLHLIVFWPVFWPLWGAHLLGLWVFGKVSR
ncbi:hypothetical protein [Rhizobium sp. SYY.PMSO]|uniref:hypothetical protein n=1 Tax=Rhizobium sp. SYY.PMSO TaxID=3382192 RepID=UPI00399033B3